MAADDDDVVQLAQTDGVGLLEGMAAGGHVNGMDGAACLIADGFPAAVQGIGLHDRAAAAAVGVVVHLVLLVGGIVPDLVGLNGDEAALLGTAQDALGQHIAQRLREEGHDINSHRCAYPR